jgi:glucose-6-phosphate 1-dehydrogenase
LEIILFIEKELKMTKSSVFVLFGSTGDLSLKKLFPSLYNLYCSRELPDDFTIIAIGRRDFVSSDFHNFISDGIDEFSRFKKDERFDEFCKLIEYFRMDFNKQEDYKKLAEKLLKEPVFEKAGGNIVFYLATSPGYFKVITESMAGEDFFQKADKRKQLILEKPFGYDLESAKDFNNIFSKYFDESEIFRTDHYLGKEMIRNILALRFANPLFEKIWNKEFIDNIQVTVFEEAGVGSRGGYYEQSGALRDMVQSHILQIVALLAMDKPSSTEAEALRDSKVVVLKALAESSADRSSVVFGQYSRSESGGIDGYREEPLVDSESCTETFAALRLLIETDSWRGVPFYVRTGKRTGTRTAYVSVSFKAEDDGLFSGSRENLLVIKIQPDEGVFFRFYAKEAGGGSGIVPVDMDYCSSCRIRGRSPEAYEKILSDAVDQRHDLFTRWDEIYYSWQYIDKVQQSCSSGRCLDFYPAGSSGPASAASLIEVDGRKWIDLV